MVYCKYFIKTFSFEEYLLKYIIMDLFKGNWFKLVAILALCLLLGIGFAKFYQPQGKSVQIYKQALKDYQNQNYSNAYFLFSKISYTSDLKPYAIYRQALCAKSLGDKTSELSSYQQLFKYYPKNKLSDEAKYQAGQLIVEDNPDLAMSYFKAIEKSNLDNDYKIAANYYKARIQSTKIRYSKQKVSDKKKQEIEEAFRKYLKNYPDGRLIASVASSWEKFNPKTNSQDTVLIAKAYSNAGLKNEADETLKRAKGEDKWAVLAVNSYLLNDYEKTKKLVEEGVEKYSDKVLTQDYNNAVDYYLKLYDPKDILKYNTKLFSIAKGDKKDYIWHLKCQNITGPQDKYVCYKDLYLNFPKSKYAENALAEVFQYAIRNKNYAKCRELAQEFLNKYPNSKYAPMVMFWAGKIEQSYGSAKYIEYYQNVINTYPDSYYAYRAFWITKGINAATINTPLDYKPVEYPYKIPSKGDVLYTLLQVKDYNLISKIIKDDFIDSWVEYEKGNYATSVTIARDAMDKMSIKPVKSDLRWRLVYPQNFYKQVQNYSQQYGNNIALMMGLIRTESSFNSEAQSSVGAIGLMQLMPTTAHEIAEKHGITLNTSYLFNPELNIKLGNIYYTTIKEMLDNREISAIAAYNGGIGSVNRWKSTLKYNDTDEFVEQIPYEETKNYVERVFRSYWNYTRIYQRG